MELQGLQWVLLFRDKRVLKVSILKEEINKNKRKLNVSVKFCHYLESYKDEL
jgi:hypothetical protein